MSDSHSQPADVSAPSGETSKAELGDVAEEPDSPESLHGIAPSTAPDRTSNSTNNGSSNGNVEAAAPRTLTGVIRQIFGLRNRSTGRQDLEEVLAKDELSGQTFSPEERDMLRNIMRLRELRVVDFMVPRADIDAVDEDTTLGEVLRLFEESGHSRMPVYRETLDDPTGFLHIKDVMALMTTEGHVEPPQDGRRRKKFPADLDLRQVDLARPISELGILRQLIFVPPSMAAQDLMTRMQAARVQMALVIDEYGGTDGLASIMDVLETVVGELDDEHDEPEGELILAAGEGVFTADARAEMDDVIKMLGAEFVVPGMEQEEDFDTIGGYVFSVIGRVPTRGELIRGFGPYEIEVLDADPKRIRHLKIYHARGSADRAKRRRTSAPPVASAQQEAE
jgi:CBS domain containing-hemolysin-like protein